MTSAQRLPGGDNRPYEQADDPDDDQQTQQHRGTRRDSAPQIGLRDTPLLSRRGRPDVQDSQQHENRDFHCDGDQQADGTHHRHVTRLRPSDAELLQLALRRAGYVHPDEIMELDECVWQMAAQLSRVPLPNTAVRCAVVASFGLPVGVSSQSPERVSRPPETRSSATAPEPVDRSWSGRGAVTGSTNERRDG